MDNKFDMDRIMYLLGQEDAMEELDKFTKPHEFSSEYESEKMKMLNNKKNRDNIPSKKSTGMMRKKLVVLIAAATATLALSLTAYGVCRNILFTASRDEAAGTVTYDVKSDIELTEIPLINITPEYLPEGYLPLNGAPGKYVLNGDPSTGEGVLIYQNNYIFQPESYNISSVEETTIGGIKAYINTSEGMDYKYKIDLIFEEEGQIISVGGTCSLEELKKVAENIKFEVVPGEFIELYKPESVEGGEEVYTAPAIPADHVLNMGDEKKYDAYQKESPMFTVNKVEILDKLPEVNSDYFWDYGEYIAAVNDDGTLKDYERSVSIKWEDNEMKYVTEPASRKFAYVTLTLINPYDKELKDIGIHPIIEYRTKVTDGSLEAFPNDRRSGNEIAGSKEAIYFDGSDYSGNHFFFCDLAPNETKEVHLIYLIDADHIDDAYVTQRGMTVNGNVNSFGYYFKVK